MDPIRGYHNYSNVFINKEPKTGGNGIRSYHLESDILFQKKYNEKEKKGIRGPKNNFESRNDLQKKEKMRKIDGREFMRTCEVMRPSFKKNIRYKNEPHPDNGLVYDFSNKPFRIGKTEKKLMPEKLYETAPKVEKGKKLFLIKNNEDPGSSLIKH